MLGMRAKSDHGPAVEEVTAVLGDLVANRDLAARAAEARGRPELLALHDVTVRAGSRFLDVPTLGNLLGFVACLEEELAVIASRPAVAATV
jgi:hypothetical protein